MQSNKNLIHFPEDLLKYLFTFFGPLDSQSAAATCKTLRSAFDQSKEMQQVAEKRRLDQKLIGLNKMISENEIQITLRGSKKIKISEENTFHLSFNMDISKVTKILYVDSDHVVFMAETDQGEKCCETHKSSLDSILSSEVKVDKTKKRKSLISLHSSVIEQDELQNTITRYKQNARVKLLYLNTLEVFKELFVGIDDFKKLFICEKSNGIFCESHGNLLLPREIALKQYDVLKPILKRLKEAGVIDYEVKIYYLPDDQTQSWQQNLSITIKNFNRIYSACDELKPLAHFIANFMHIIHDKKNCTLGEKEAEQKILELNKNGEIPFVYHYDQTSKTWVLSYLQENEIRHEKVAYKAQACELLATLFEAHKVTLQPMQIDKRLGR